MTERMTKTNTKNNNINKQSVVFSIMSNTIHYRIIFVAISSHNHPVYPKMKELSRLYYCLFPTIKLFFLESREQETDVVETDDHLYINGVESIIPGIHQKTAKAMEYINQTYSYDYLVRTNLSTMWNIDHLLRLLSDAPLERFATGFAYQGFITGTGVILSKDVVGLIAASPIDFSNYEDVALSRIIQSHGISIRDITEYKFGFMIPKELFINGNSPACCKYLEAEDDFSDVLSFRIRNDDIDPSRETDLQWFRVVLKKVYDIDVVFNV